MSIRAWETVRASLGARLARLNLRGKITLALVAGTLLVGGLVAGSTFLLARKQILDSTQSLLEARAKLERREIELRVGAVLAEAASLAGNSVTANALADSMGRETYLEPLLQNYKPSWPGATLALTDYKGKIIASSTPGAAMGEGAQRAFAGMANANAAYASVGPTPQGTQILSVAIPVVYRLTGSVEGAVLLQFAPSAVVLPDAQEDWGLYDSAGLLLAGTAPPQGPMQVRSALTLPEPLGRLGLTHILSIDKSLALKSLNYLLAAYFSGGILLVLGALKLSQAAAGQLSEPMRRLTEAAEKIAASGRPSTWIAPGEESEFNRIATAFNLMVTRLGESYTDLESRVEIRTREMEAAKLAAEKAGNLLQEAVSSIAQGFTIYDEHDRLVLCNEAYLNLYGISRDLIVPGARFEDIIRAGMQRGQYADPAARADPDAWVRHRVAQHQVANGEVIEQRLGDGRWLLVVEYRTPSGYIVGNRIDVTELKQTAESLRERELYLRATLDNLPFLFWLKDAEGRFLAVNKVFATACGRDRPDDLRGLSDLDIWPQDLAEGYRADDRAVMQSRCEKSVDEPMEHGGKKGWIETYKKPVIAEDGAILGTVGFARDITDRRSMELALAESEERWQLAVTGTNDGIWDWSPVTGKVYFSDRWKTMLGYRAEEVGDDVDEWASRVHPEDRELVMAAIECHLRGETEFYQSEHRVLCKDGSYKWILDRGRASFDSQGKPLRVVGSHTDMTERRAAEAATLDRTEQLNAIFQLSPDGFVAFDADHRVKYASPAFALIAGLPEARVVGLDEVAFSSLLNAQCVPNAGFRGVAALRESIRNPRAKAAGRRELIEIAQPSVRVLEVGLRESQAASVPQILYFRDVTHEVEVERMKSEFVSTAAHELRTPMASIYGFSELLKEQKFDEATQQDLFATIHRNAGLMASIINELLDLARIEARRGKDFEFKAVPVQDLLEKLVADYKPPAGREAPLLELPGQVPYVRADLNKMKQALGNVLSNAFKYSPGGGAVRITLDRRRRDEGPPEIGLRISDAGIGMKPEQVARVSERFYRADTSGTIPGTGLGMSIVSEIVGLHGGEMEIASEFGAGTQVTLWIPAAEAPAEAA